MHASVRAHAVDHTPIVTAPAVVLDVLREGIEAVRAEEATILEATQLVDLHNIGSREE